MSLLFAILVASASPRQASESPARPPSGEQRKCQTVEVTGSVLRRKVCKSKDEWKEAEQRDKDNVDRFHDLTRPSRSDPLIKDD